MVAQSKCFSIDAKGWDVFGFGFSATTIGEIYRDRWKIELFFYVLRQRLKIRTLVGTNPNCLKDPDLDSIDRPVITQRSPGPFQM